jgi:hypothetical protein
MSLFKRLIKQWWVLPALVVFVGFAVAAIIILRTRQSQVPQAVVMCGGDQASEFSCYKEYLSETVQAAGPEAAFTSLKVEYDRNSYVQSQCHQLTHVIGQVATKKYPDVGSAYSHGDSFCWSGYYHGVMQGIAAKVGFNNLKAQANSICESVSNSKKRYGFDHFNCVHGLGHGFMGIQSNELFTSLGTCDVLHDQWEKESCYGGVFMENVMAFQSTDTKTKYLKADDAMYPCTDVATTYKEQCYLMQTSHALVVFNNDFKNVFTACSQVEELEFQRTCYQSLGRDASGQSNSNAKSTKQTCMLGSTEIARSNCVIGAVKDFISYFHSNSQAMDFCKSLDESALRATCVTEGNAYFKLL